MAKTGRMLRVFKSTLSSIQTLLPNGKPVPFINGRHVTDDPYTIAYLDQMVIDKHPQIYVDPDDFEVDEGLVDPQEAMRERIIAEYLASQAIAAGDPNRDMGSTDQNMKLNVGNTSNIADAAAGGSGLSQNVRLVNLQKESQAILSALPKPVAVNPAVSLDNHIELSAKEEAAAQQTFKQAKDAENAAALALQLKALANKTPVK